MVGGRTDGRTDGRIFMIVWLWNTLIEKHPIHFCKESVLPSRPGVFRMCGWSPPPPPTPTPSFKISLQNEALCALKVPPELSLRSALLKGIVFTHVIALRQLQPVPPLPLPPPPSLPPSLPPAPLPLPPPLNSWASPLTPHGGSVGLGMLRCFLTASKWTSAVSRLRRSGTISSWPFPRVVGKTWTGPAAQAGWGWGWGSVHVGVRVGAERRRRRRRRGGGGGRREEEHNSPVPVRAYGLENRSHARLALKKGDRSWDRARVFSAESLQI